MKERFTRAYFPLCRLVSSLLGPSTCMRVGWSLKEGRSVPRPWQQMPPTPPRNDEVPPPPLPVGPADRVKAKQTFWNEDPHLTGRLGRQTLFPSKLYLLKHSSPSCISSPRSFQCSTIYEHCSQSNRLEKVRFLFFFNERASLYPMNPCAPSFDN